MKLGKHRKRIDKNLLIIYTLFILTISYSIGLIVLIKNSICNTAEIIALQNELDTLKIIDEAKTNEINKKESNIAELNTKVEDLTKELEKKKVTSRSSSERITDGEYVAFTATAYCPCAQCCGKTNGITASGTKATAGRTVAMSSSYSFGTKIEIRGLGTYVVEDRGGAIQSNRIDIYFDTHQEALNFGRRTVYLKVIK